MYALYSFSSADDFIFLFIFLYRHAFKLYNLIKSIFYLIKPHSLTIFLYYKKIKILILENEYIIIEIYPPKENCLITRGSSLSAHNDRDLLC